MGRTFNRYFLISTTAVASNGKGAPLCTPTAQTPRSNAAGHTMPSVASPWTTALLCVLGTISTHIIFTVVDVMVHGVEVWGTLKQRKSTTWLSSYHVRNWMALAGQAEFSRIVVSEGMYQNLVLAFVLCNLVSSDKHMSWIWTDGLPLRTYYFGIYGEGMCGLYSTRCPFLKPRMRELTWLILSRTLSLIMNSCFVCNKNVW
jgi:hypothetical protein